MVSQLPILTEFFLKRLSHLAFNFFFLSHNSLLLPIHVFSETIFEKTHFYETHWPPGTFVPQLEEEMHISHLDSPDFG